jgi:SPP1 family predicted phage head-tail adaptor
MLQSRIRAGDLDQEITFIQPSVSVGDANSDYISGWNTVSPTDWARKVDRPGNEVVINDRPTYVQKTTWTIRYRSDITERMRIVHEGKVYEIISIHPNNSSRNRFLDIVSQLLDTETS